MCVRETLEGAHLVGADADHRIADTFERVQGVAKVAGFFRASRRRGLRVEIDDDALIGFLEEFRQMNGAVRGFGRKIGGDLPHFELAHDLESTEYDAHSHDEEFDGRQQR